MSDIRKAAIQQTALTRILPYNRCGVAISMGVGKTLIGLQHMDYQFKNNRFSASERFLVATPKKSIYASWKDDAVKFGMEYLLPYIEFTSYRSLNKLDPSAYHTIYLDECHSLLYSHELWLNSYGGGILGLTGTKPRYENSEKGYMVDRFCPMVYEYITDDAILDNILNEYKIFVHPISLGTTKTLQVVTKKFNFMTTEVANYAYCNERIENSQPQNEAMARIMRMKQMQGYNSKMHYLKLLLKRIQGKCLVFCNTQDQADEIAIHSYHSKNKASEENLQRFKDGEFEVLSCVDSLNEGINVPNLKNIIIMHSYSNERKAMQRLGRALRLNPDDVAMVHILMYADTIDDKWVKSALKDLDQSKITYLRLNALTTIQQ